jgi:DNA-binding MarR family transcriptional regulator
LRIIVKISWKSARYLSRLYGSHLAPAGLTVSQFSILGLLGVHGRLKITELADRLIMERTSLVRALKPLQAAGWVVAERSDNGRAFDVTLSPSGLKKFAEAKPLWAEAANVQLHTFATASLFLVSRRRSPSLLRSLNHPLRR